MAATTVLHVRIDEQLKIQTIETLTSIGLTVSDAVRAVLKRVVADKQLPFELRTPNTQMRESNEVIQSYHQHSKTVENSFNTSEYNLSLQWNN